MKLRDSVVPVIVSGAILFTAWGASLDPTVREAWEREEVAVGRVYDAPLPLHSLVRVADAIGSWMTHLFHRELSEAERIVLLDEARLDAASTNASHVQWNPPEGWEPEYTFNGTSVGLGLGNSDSIPAFWNCQGPGCGAQQQYRTHGIRNCRVSNLNSSGSGSFQACMAIVEADSNTANKPMDYITFDVAGAIDLSPTCSQHACSLWRGVVIACQSAPGPVLFYRWGMNMQPGSEDFVMRGCALRGKTGTYQTIFAGQGRRLVVDHSSFSSGNSRQVHFLADTLNSIPNDHDKYEVRGVSFTRNFMGYTRGATGPTTLMFSTSPRAPSDFMQQALVSRNLFVTMAGQYRLPNVSADSIWVHNNVYWGINWGAGPANALTSEFVISFTYNYMRTNNTNKADDSYYLIGPDSLGACHYRGEYNAVDPYDPEGEICALAEKRFYASVNNRYGDADTLSDQAAIWRGAVGLGGRYLGTYYYTDSTSPPLEHRQTTEIPYHAPFGYDSLSPNDANAQIIADSAGGGFHIDSFGLAYMRQDSFDVRFLLARTNSTQYRRAFDSSTAANGNLFVDDADTLSKIVGWYAAQADSKCRDDDDDGMCDRWEIVASGSTALDFDDVGASGYYAIELSYEGGIQDIDEPWTGGPSPPTGATCDTYSSGRCVYLFPLAGVETNDTLLIVGEDTFSVKGGTADFDSLPPAALGGPQAMQWIVATHDSAVVLTCDPDLSTADQDSADIDALFSTWGINGSLPWQVTPPRDCP